MTIKDYSSTAASNTAINGVSIAGTAPVSNMDDGLRQVMADIANWTDSDTLVSATTTDLSSVDGMYVTVSGTATIVGLGTVKAGVVKFVRFTGAGQITHNATSLILPDGVNITRANGDAAVFVSEGSGNWRCLFYRYVGGLPVTSGGTGATSGTGARSNIGAAGLADNNRFTAIQRWSKGADVASAATLTLGDDGNYFDITGTTAIQSISAKGVGTVVRLHFDDALTLTHHATDLALPGGVNITTAAGDEAEFVEYATSDWRCTNYLRSAATQAEMEAGSATNKIVTPANFVYHPSAAKTWCHCGVTGNVIASYGVSSVTDNGTGDVTINHTTLSDATGAILQSTHTPGAVRISTIEAFTASTVRINCWTVAQAAIDPSAYFMVRFGDI